nr:MAG TPA: Cbb3-type cytochrome c oxidase subunit [Caudoviricetes sp.]
METIVEPVIELIIFIVFMIGILIMITNSKK